MKLKHALLAALGTGTIAYALSRAFGASVPVRALSKDEAKRFSLLLPPVQAALVRLRQSLADAGVQTFVGQTYQTAEAAADAYSGGRSATTRSWHRVRRAVDLYVWDEANGLKPDLRAKRQDLYARMGAIAQTQGWRWLGLGVITNQSTGATFTDPQHLEFRQGLTYEQASAQVGL